jgi:hypothetical protein
VPELTEINVSKETYAELCALVDELQTKKKRPVSMDEALQYLIHRSRKVQKISCLAGSLEITDSEAKDAKASIDKAWETWKQ